MKKYLIFGFLCFLSTIGFSQEHTLSGYMRDADSGEELLYANVIVENTSTGVTTNLYGFYSLTLEQGTYQIEYSYIGFESQIIEIVLDKDIVRDVELGSGSLQIEEIVVTAKSGEEDANVVKNEMSVVSLDIKDAKLIPVLLGEQDILKTLQLMPGVSAGSEGGSGFFVRGGDADQNLILLDEAPVYNASHLLGFFSVFNSDALKDVKLYKGGIPAEYGGRISSVLDVRMKNGNSKKFSGSGGLGLISSRLTLESPIVKDKGSVIISGRRTYADLLLKTFDKEFDDLSLYFYDLNMKANYKLGDNDRLYVSGYLGRDVFSSEGFGFDWGNKTLTMRWNHTFNPKLFSNTTLIYSDYDYGFQVERGGNKIDLDAGIFNYNFKQDFNYYLNQNNTIRFGLNANLYDFKPGNFASLDESGEVDFEVNLDKRKALENGFYLSNEQKINDKLSLTYGLRLSTFSDIGAYDEKEYDEEGEIINTTTYESGEFYNTTFGLAPRINAKYQMNDVSSIKTSYNRTYQYLHLLSNSNSGTPTDLWIPSSPLVKPEFADQVALGYFRNFKDNQYEFSAEVYYKDLKNQVDFKDGGEALLNEDIEADLTFGEGKAYGVEFLMRKKQGKLTGWIGYTLSTSQRKFDDINNGEWFSARQDRTHDLSVVASYQLTKKLTLSSSFVYYTGDAVTFPTGKYEIDGALINLYSDRNADRMPDYHRFDMGLTWKLKEKKNYNSDLNFSIYNLYNRKNAYTISFEESKTSPGTAEAVRLSLFGIVPSVTWNFNF